jgi:hypothetical protein
MSCRSQYRSAGTSDAAALEPLQAAIAAAGAKVEQETIQRRLYALT